MERRTPLKRSQKPLKRSPLARSTKPIRKRRPGPPRRGPANVPPERWRNHGYLRFLRAEGKCRACVIECQRAHDVLSVDSVRAAMRVISTGCDPMHGPPNGRSQKGPDAEAIPGCRSHHDEQTAIGWLAFESKYGFSREREAAIWWTAFLIWREHENAG